MQEQAMNLVAFSMDQSMGVEEMGISITKLNPFLMRLLTTRILPEKNFIILLM